MGQKVIAFYPFSLLLCTFQRDSYGSSLPVVNKISLHNNRTYDANYTFLLLILLLLKPLRGGLPKS